MFPSLIAAWTLPALLEGCKPKPVPLPAPVSTPIVPSVELVEFCPNHQPSVADVDAGDLYRMINRDVFVDAVNAARHAANPGLPVVEPKGCREADVLSVSVFNSLVTKSKEALPPADDFLLPVHGVWTIRKDVAAATGHQPTVATKSAVSNWENALGLNALVGSVTGVGAKIVVVDAGARKHPMLGGLPSTACFASGSCGSVPPQKNSCVPGDGTQSCGICLTSAECAHGNGMAGIIGGHGPNNPADQAEAAMHSIAPDALVLPVRVMANHERTSPYALQSDVLAALQWVSDQNKSGLTADYHIIYLGMASSVEDATIQCASPGSSPMQVVINQLYDQGFRIVAPAGNSARGDVVAAPACFDHVISVAAGKGNTAFPAEWSNGTTTADVMAPGEGVAVSAAILVPDTVTNGQTVKGDYAWSTGTSVAAAQVAGALALLEERMGDNVFLAAPEQTLVSCLGGGAQAQVNGMITDCAPIATNGPKRMQLMTLHP